MPLSPKRIKCIASKVPTKNLANVSKNRRNQVISAHFRQKISFGTKGQYKGIMDAFHGETNFGLEKNTFALLNKAWEEIIYGRADLTETDGSPYDKKNPKILQALSARYLFNHLKQPAPQISGVEVKPEEVLLCPYSSTVLLEEALATVAQPNGVILCPEGFYKYNELHVGKLGMNIKTCKVRSDSNFKVIPQSFLHTVRSLKHQKKLCAVLFTIPGNPILAEYTKKEMEEIAQIIVDEKIKVICDSVFHRFLPNHIPIASLSVERNGHRISLYDYVLTITSNSKSYNAFGPCKFGAACTGNSEWRELLSQRLTIAFQRETTHLCRVILENTSEEYFQKNLRSMAQQQLLAKEIIEKINSHYSSNVIRICGSSQNGIFLSLEFSGSLIQKAGIQTNSELEDMLFIAQGIDSVSFGRMGSDLNAVRLNIIAPRKDGLMDKNNIIELFNRVEALVNDIHSGLTYSQLLHRFGLLRVHEDPSLPNVNTG